VSHSVFGPQHLPSPLRRAIVLVAACSLATAAFAAVGAFAQTPVVGATSEVRDTSGRLVATAEFREGRGEVLITLLFPTPAILTGTHGIHITSTGRCDPPDFQTAGPTFNPFNKKHGRQNPEGPEVGDLPNLNIVNGLTSYNTSAAGASLAPGPASLLGASKTALVIFSGEDDQLTDPEGSAGSRIACGVINAASGVPSAPAAAAPVAGAPVAGVPTPTVTRTNTPVVVQPPQVVKPAVATSPVPAQPVAAQPAQPAVKPVVSPVVVQPPQVVKPAVAASPVVAAPAAAAPAIPTPIVAAPTPAPLAVAAPATQTGGLGSMTALVIAVLGVGLVGAGYLLRRRSQVQ
jgi:Cu-Zn family superoxide dismutase